ncbi:MAG: Ldh family oxidoreductase, partial [Pseudomonadota bacterium]
MADIYLVELQALLDAVFADMAKDHRTSLVQTIMDAERDHAHSHGIFRVPGYWKSLKSGKVNGQAKPVMRRLSPA